MKITFLPMRRDDRLTLDREGDILTLNGARFDFGHVQEGAELDAEAIASDWFAGPVRRVEGQLQVTLLLPHGHRAPRATLFPEPLQITEDGPVPVPAHSGAGQASGAGEKRCPGLSGAQTPRRRA